MGGLTKTVAPSKSQEFTIHVPSSYDYRFSSARREEIIDVLKRLHLIEQKQNVPVFRTQSKDLKDFTTTERDMKKQINRFPSNDYRAYNEDLFQLATPGLQHQQSSTVIDTMDNIDGNQKIRKAQQEGDGSFQSED